MFLFLFFSHRKKKKKKSVSIFDFEHTFVWWEAIISEHESLDKTQCWRGQNSQPLCGTIIQLSRGIHFAE